jgi:hypothetical protein
VNALADERVIAYLQENCVPTYLKVGTFQIINGQKVGGNVASYFCLPDGAVIHAVPGKVGAEQLLSEARWAHETHKLSATFSTDLVSGSTDAPRQRLLVQQAHVERYLAAASPARLRGGRVVDATALLRERAMPRHVSQQAQAHWLLARAPLVKLDQIYPIVWQDVLREPLSGLPVAVR